MREMNTAEVLKDIADIKKRIEGLQWVAYALLERAATKLLQESKRPGDVLTPNEIALRACLDAVRQVKEIIIE